MQVVDNLVLLHSQAEGRSRIYDLQLVSKDPAVEVNIRISFFLLHFDFLRWISTYFFQVDGPDLLQPSLPATAICRQVRYQGVTKKHFFSDRFRGLTTGANQFPEPTKKVSKLQTHKRHLENDFQCSRGYSWGNFQKSIFGNKILQERATTIQIALLSYIFIALFRDTPLATISRTWPDGQMAKNGQIWPKWPFIAIWSLDHMRQIWASGVSLKRAMKMQLSSANQMVVTRSYQILLPKNDFLPFSH